MNFRLEVDENFAGIAYCRGLWRWRVVRVGVMWSRLNSMERAAVISHEMGHFAHRHLEKRLLMLPGFLFKNFVSRLNLQEELEADQHAVSNGHGWVLLRLLERLDGVCQQRSARIDALTDCLKLRRVV